MPFLLIPGVAWFLGWAAPGWGQDAEEDEGGTPWPVYVLVFVALVFGGLYILAKAGFWDQLSRAVSAFAKPLIDFNTSAVHALVKLVPFL